MHKHVIAKVIALVLIGVCLTLGIVGLVLPIIPGLLFLALGAAIVARHSSWAGERLRRHRGIDRCLDHADGFIDADWSAKLKLAALYTAKATVDGLAGAIRVVRSLADRLRGGSGRSTFRI